MINDDIKTLTTGDIRGLKVEQLSLRDAPMGVHSVVMDLDETQEIGLASDLAKKIKDFQMVNSNKPETKGLQTIYEDELDLLRFVILASLDERTIEELFSTKLVKAINSGIHIIQHVERYLTLFADVRLGLAFTQLVIRALDNNKETIGTNQIRIESEDKLQAPIVRNWLRNYNQSSRSTSGSAVLRESQYFSTSRDYLQLSSSDKEILKTVVKLYDFLRFPDEVGESIVPSNEIPQNLEPILTEPAIETRITAVDLKPATDKKSAIVEQEILRAYQGDQRQQKEITKEIKKLDKKFGQSVEALRSEFFQTVQKKNLNRTVAALMLLTQKDDLLTFISEDSKLNKFLAAIWEKQYGADLVADFKINPTDVKYVRLFLQYVLEQRLGMKENEAARVGLQIGNAFVSLGKKSYNKMAYFDVATKEFKWFE